MHLEEQIIICNICEEELQYKDNLGVEHLKKFPSHRDYTQMKRH
jgi:hypothetical protein